MPDGFHLDISHAHGAAVIAVAGELDLSTGPELEAELDRIAPDQTRAVIVDLRRLEFMDSTGLSIIVRAHQRLAQDGCDMALVPGTPQVQRLLDLTGVTDRLRLLATPEELLDGS